MLGESVGAGGDNTDNGDFQVGGSGGLDYVRFKWW